MSLLRNESRAVNFDGRMNLPVSLDTDNEVF